MINVAMVEDDIYAANVLKNCIDKFQQESTEKFSIAHFKDAETFLNDYRHNYDLVFMDIELPNINGMEAAIKLREIDKQIALIFVTNMTQFAVKGYAVNALDYIIKPVEYSDFVFKLQKAIDVIKENEAIELVILQQSGIFRVSTRQIQYIEVSGHKLSYHLASEVIVGTGTMTDLEKSLSAFGFLRSNNCYLVNPKYIEAVKGFSLIMRNGDELQISHPRKKKFMAELAKWLGQGNFV